MRERGVDGKARRNAGGAEERARGHGWGGLSERMEGRGATDTGRTTWGGERGRRARAESEGGERRAEGEGAGSVGQGGDLEP